MLKTVQSIWDTFHTFSLVQQDVRKAPANAYLKIT